MDSDADAEAEADSKPEDMEAVAEPNEEYISYSSETSLIRTFDRKMNFLIYFINGIYPDAAAAPSSSVRSTPVVDGLEVVSVVEGPFG